MVKATKFKIGIIGCGLQGRRRAESLMKSPDAELVIVTDVLPQKAKLLAEEMKCTATDSWEDVVAMQDIDIVAVCTPPNLHLPMCTVALEHGKHVLCEKPLARNPEEAKQILEKAQEKGLKLKGGFNLRHHPGIQQAYAWLEQGMIGKPFSMRVCYGIGGRHGYDKEWRADKEIAGGGQLMDQGVHAIDLSRWFLGEFSEVIGFNATYFWEVAPLEDNSFTLLRTARGQIAAIYVSWTQWKNLFSLELAGQDGYIKVEGLGGSYGTECVSLGKRDFLKPFREEIIEYRGGDQSWVEEWAEFFSAIKEDREPLGNGNDGFQAVRLAYAVYTSAQRGIVEKV